MKNIMIILDFVKEHTNEIYDYWEKFSPNEENFIADVKFLELIKRYLKEKNLLK